MITLRHKSTVFLLYLVVYKSTIYTGCKKPYYQVDKYLF